MFWGIFGKTNARDFAANKNTNFKIGITFLHRETIFSQIKKKKNKFEPI